MVLTDKRQYRITKTDFVEHADKKQKLKSSLTHRSRVPTHPNNLLSV